MSGLSVSWQTPQGWETLVDSLKTIRPAWNAKKGPALTDIADAGEKAVQDAAGSLLPHRGGLAGMMAQRRVGRAVTDQGLTLSIGATSAAMDAGSFIHPVFGMREVQVTQDCSGGYFSHTLAQMMPRTVDQKMKGVVDVIESNLRR